MHSFLKHIKAFELKVLSAEIQAHDSRACVCGLCISNSLTIEIQTLSTSSERSFKMSIIPLWPNLQPRATDPLWFNADRPCDDESEVAALEAEHQAWVSTLHIT